MARQIAYDPVELRTDLLSVFWRQGYAETSLSDLEAATGLNRRQLYNGPGDKLAMFLQAMDDFSDQAGRMFLTPLENETAGVRDIANLLNTFVNLSQTKDGRKGCLVCSVSQEEVAADPKVRARADAYFDRIKAAYHNALTQAAKRNEVDLDAEGIAQRSARLFAAHVALCILGRAGRPVEELRDIAADAAADLG
ncbi:TetR/AcrR family transcriptional regulator [Litoreibacter roseus]|uniref:TetR family transcriptional regulator n=1 Tax=Litoreibacter roseus TaxID=2601869 RepID=A0A6N6JHW5_9RHOB|nr:hypothetical protein [Litoreibacter roseus]GFE65704.1 TetR family transcriptional regulator [Litoreibacter roseus]